jgi:hypothetical protein
MFGRDFSQLRATSVFPRKFLLILCLHLPKKKKPQLSFHLCVIISEFIFLYYLTRRCSELLLIKYFSWPFCPADYVEKKALSLGLENIFLLTTRTADW